LRRADIDPGIELGSAYSVGTLLKLRHLLKDQVTAMLEMPADRALRIAGVGYPEESHGFGQCPRRAQPGELARLLKRELAEVEVFLQSPRPERRSKENDQAAKLSSTACPPMASANIPDVGCDAVPQSNAAADGASRSVGCSHPFVFVFPGQRH
jgi:hypothetical protein